MALIQVNASRSCQPVIHVRKDGTRIITDGIGAYFAVVRNGNVFEIDDDYLRASEMEAFAHANQDAIAPFLMAA